MKSITLILALFTFLGGCDQKDNTDDPETVNIPAVSSSCSTASDPACADIANDGDGYAAAIFATGVTCADLAGEVTIAAIKLGAMTCTGTTCTGAVTSGEGWMDDTDAAITVITPGTYSVATVFDFNNNLLANEGAPDTGDLVCCIDDYTVGTSAIILEEDTTGVTCTVL